MGSIDYDEDKSEEFRKKTNQMIKKGIALTKVASKKIDDSIKHMINKTTTNPKLNEVKVKTTEAVKLGIEKSKQTHKKSTPSIKKLGQKSLLGLEKFVGTIRKGTQYGKTSIDMLEQFSKMKELGIITEEEFEKKKKEILDRI